MKFRRICLLPLLLLVHATGWGAADHPVYVGVLEDAEPSGVSRDPPAPLLQVRIAFTRNGSGWVPVLSDDPVALTTWNVALDGRKIGAVTTAPENAGHSGVLKVTSDPAQVPRIKLGSLQIYYEGMQASHRPLLVSSRPDVADPDGWKPAQLTRTELQRLHAAFRKLVPLMQQCDEPETGPTRYVPYSDEDIVLLSAYRSKDGSLLVGQKLTHEKLPCDWYDDRSRDSYWQAFGANGTSRLLGLGILPLEAADLDADGHSEWLFKTDYLAGCGYKDAYTLYYDGFAKMATYRW